MARNLFKKLLVLGLATLCPQIAVSSDAVFSANLTLLEPIELSLSAELEFPILPAGQKTVFERDPEDEAALIFSARGTANTIVTGAIIESAVVLHTDPGEVNSDSISIGNFTTGGDFSDSGRATFDKNGELNNLRIGATANIEANDKAGAYTATATFRLTYN